MKLEKRLIELIYYKVPKLKEFRTEVRNLRGGMIKYFFLGSLIAAGIMLGFRLVNYNLEKRKTQNVSVQPEDVKPRKK